MYVITSVWYNNLPDRIKYGEGWIPFAVHSEEGGWRVWLRKELWKEATNAKTDKD